MSDSVRPHRRQPTRLPCPWDSPGKNTGVGCHFLLQCRKVKSERSCSVVSDSLQPHGLQPTRLLHPWDFPGKSTGVGCHCLLHWDDPSLKYFWVHLCSQAKYSAHELHEAPSCCVVPMDVNFPFMSAPSRGTPSPPRLWGAVEQRQVEELTPLPLSLPLLPQVYFSLIYFTSFI